MENTTVTGQHLWQALRCEELDDSSRPANDLTGLDVRVDVVAIRYCLNDDASIPASSRI